MPSERYTVICPNCQCEVTAGLMSPVEEIRNLPVIPHRTVKEIVRQVSVDRLISVREIEGPSRQRSAAWARHEVFWRARQLKTWDGKHRFSLPAIGRYFEGKGGRTEPMNHTSVRHGAIEHAKRLREAQLEAMRADAEEMAAAHGRAA